VKGARKLYTSVRGGAGAADDVHPTVVSTSGGARGVDARMTQVENRLAALMAEQQASTEVIRNLADQNARLIEAVGIMRARARILIVLSVVSSVGCLALAIWAITR